MKKTIIYLLISLIGFTACSKKKEEPPITPASTAQNNCMGTVWTYSVTVSPAVTAGSINIVYNNGNPDGTTVFDTTVTASWTKSITINTPLTGTQVNYPIVLQVSKLKPIGTTSVTMCIYKNSIAVVPPGTAVLNTTLLLQTSCN